MSLSAAEARLAEAADELADLTVELQRAHRSTSDSQRIELVTLRAQVEVLKGQIESYEKESRTCRSV